MVEIIPYFKRIALINAAVTVLLSLAVLITSQFDLIIIKNLFPDQLVSNPVTAVCFICSASALFFLSKERAASIVTGRLLALAVLAVGSVVFCAILLGLNTPVDKWLYTEKLFLYGALGKPNYMAPNTAFCFLLTGVSLSMHNYKLGSNRYVADVCALLCALIAYTSVLGYLYGADEFYNFKSHIPMAFPTAMSFFLISLAVLLSRSSFGLLRVFTKPYSGSKIARRLIPFAVIVPSALGILRIKGEEAELYSREFGMVLFTTSSVVIFVFLIWLSSVYINKANKALHMEVVERMRLNDQLNKFNKALEETVTEKTRQLMMQAMLHQRQVLQASFEGQEIQRKHIGMELHDNVNQMLATAILYMDMAAGSPEEREAMRATSKSQVRAAIKEIRGLSQELVSYKIEEGELQGAILELIDPIEASSNILIEVSVPEKINVHLSGEQRTALYRIVQEQLNNILKHAKASQIHIELQEDRGTCELTIRDDGQGFDTEQKRTGIGLSNIQSRVELLNGDLAIKSMPGSGCELTIQFPTA